MFKASNDARHLVSQQLTLVARALQAAHFTIRNVHESEMALNDTFVSYCRCRQLSVYHPLSDKVLVSVNVYTVYYIESISMLHQF